MDRTNGPARAAVTRIARVDGGGGTAGTGGDVYRVDDLCADAPIGGRTISDERRHGAVRVDGAAATVTFQANIAPLELATRPRRGYRRFGYVGAHGRISVAISVSVSVAVSVSVTVTVSITVTVAVAVSVAVPVAVSVASSADPARHAANIVSVLVTFGVAVAPASGVLKALITDSDIKNIAA